jgi:hypothetical protein
MGNLYSYSIMITKVIILKTLHNFRAPELELLIVPRT